jgi:large subunit ribosomal protein L37Ae
MTKLKISKSAGRFGPRYGVSVRRRIADIESRQRKKQQCIFCDGRAKRLSKGIWLCQRCGKKFAGHAYYLLKDNTMTQSSMETKSKPLKKETPLAKEKEIKKEKTQIKTKK